MSNENTASKGVGSTGGSANITRDGIEVQIGQRWQDQDKRMRGRVIEVRAVADGYAYFGPALNRRIAIRRMHKHSTGFVFLPNVEVTHAAGDASPLEPRKPVGDAKCVSSSDWLDFRTLDSQI